MSSVNKVILVGHLGNQPELRRTKTDQPVTELRIATTEYWKDRDGQRQERTEWHSVQVWGRDAEHCERFLSKGRLVYVEGRLQTREYTPQDGIKRYKTEIVAQTVRFLGSRGEGGEGGGGGGGGAGGAAPRGGRGGDVGGGWGGGGGGRSGGSEGGGWGGGGQGGGGQDGGGFEDDIPF
jgi:single-strand DNA-binding protein